MLVMLAMIVVECRYSEGVSSLGACIISHRAQRDLKQLFLGMGRPSLKAQQVFLFFPGERFQRVRKDPAVSEVVKKTKHTVPP